MDEGSPPVQLVEVVNDPSVGLDERTRAREGRYAVRWVLLEFVGALVDEQLEGQLVVILDVVQLVAQDLIPVLQELR